ncbi:DUF2746 domain-containing protein [Nocardia grenadensis]|uniref:DUF2746 domain-containing protein n=1 Tax=Nocardia grenadensis TaxID=931537 RepID=UPI003D728CB3
MNLPSDAPQYLWVLAIIAPIVGTWITTRMHREQKGTLAEVKEQVANTHSTNLREDIDKIAESVEQINTRLDRLEKNALQRLVGRLI